MREPARTHRVTHIYSYAHNVGSTLQRQQGYSCSLPACVNAGSTQPARTCVCVCIPKNEPVGAPGIPAGGGEGGNADMGAAAADIPNTFVLALAVGARVPTPRPQTIPCDTPPGAAAPPAGANGFAAGCAGCANPGNAAAGAAAGAAGCAAVPTPAPQAMAGCVGCDCAGGCIRLNAPVPVSACPCIICSTQGLVSLIG